MTIQIDGTTTVRELVGRYRQTRPVFERYGIDYCCGGGQPLADVARDRGLKLSALASALQQSLASPPSPSTAVDRDWYAASLVELVEHGTNDLGHRQTTPVARKASRDAKGAGSP
jgi:regulator of cell morphogenesis and NO signaling